MSWKGFFAAIIVTVIIAIAAIFIALIIATIA